MHGTGIALALPEDRGKGALTRSTAIPECDGLITDSEDVWLALTFADCVPILLHDPVHRAVGIAHAGWRGTVAGVARAAVEAMTRAFGTEPADLVAAIGPSIGPCCYEVGPEVVAAAEASLPSPDVAISGPSNSNKPGNACLDLWAANRSVLIDAGVQPDKVETAGMCTSCNRDRFYSHRGDGGRTGRFAAIIGIRGRG